MNVIYIINICYLIYIYHKLFCMNSCYSKSNFISLNIAIKDNFFAIKNFE